MRIIGGTYRGKKLLPPQTDTIRPTTDRMRETLFNILEHGVGPRIRDAKVLDLFAGTGALGIEAISRGANYVTFVDKDPKSMKLVKQNTALINGIENVDFIITDGTHFSSRSGNFDIIFVDPPYNKELITPTLKNINDQNLLAQHGLVVIEFATSEEIKIPTYFTEVKTRKIGDATFSILEKN